MVSSRSGRVWPVARSSRAARLRRTARSSGSGPVWPVALVLVGTLGVWLARRLTRAIARPVEVESRVTVLAPRDEVWRAWAHLEHLPRFLRHVDRVEVLGGRISRWTAHLADPSQKVSWLAEETERIEEQRIAWRTLEGQPLHQDGEVDFESDPQGRGTIVRLKLRFAPVSGSPAQLVAAYFTRLPKLLAREELRRFKAFVETGEVPSIEGQPHGTVREQLPVHVGPPAEPALQVGA